MATNTISSNVSAINRRSVLKGSIATVAATPVLSVTTCSAPATAAMAPIYSKWLALDLAHLPLLQEFDFGEMFDLMPRRDEYHALMEQIDQTPANSFEEIAVKVLLGTIDGGGAWRDETLISAREDAKRLLSENGLMPQPCEFSEGELEPIREGARVAEEEQKIRIAERARGEERSARFRDLLEEHGPEQITELMQEFLTKQSA